MENNYKILLQGMQISLICDKLPGVGIIFSRAFKPIASLENITCLGDIVSSGIVVFFLNCAVSLPDCYIICCMKNTGLEPL